VLRFVHLVAAAFWLGGLMLLPIVVFCGLRTVEHEAFVRLLRAVGWSFAIGSLLAWTVLGVTGYLLARQHVAGFADLNRTEFGQRLSVKIGLAAVALMTAVVHTITSRSKARSLLTVSRVLAVATFLATLGVFYQAAQLGA
jgi:putative copper export protein